MASKTNKNNRSRTTALLWRVIRVLLSPLIGMRWILRIAGRAIAAFLIWLVQKVKKGVGILFHLVSLPFVWTKQLFLWVRQFLLSVYGIATHKPPHERKLRPQDRLPPEMTTAKCVLLLTMDALLLISFISIVWLCLAIYWFPEYLPPCICWAYIAFGVFLFSFVFDRVLRHRLRVHDARLEDRSVVEASIVEANTVELRLKSPIRPENLEDKIKFLNSEIARLNELGPEGWTEFQVLSLSQMLVDFLKLDELKARALSTLAWLEDYAEDSLHPYDTRQFVKWEVAIEGEIEKIDRNDLNRSKQDDVAEGLRAYLRELQEHVAEYQTSWVKGKVLLRDLKLCCGAAILIFGAMGLLPVYFRVSPDDPGILNLFSWAFLGVSGALTAVLLQLYRSNQVDVGNTEGEGEIWRTGLGALLGFVAGGIVYHAIGGELVSFGNPPLRLDSPEPTHRSVFILLAFGSGMVFERIFERIGRKISGVN